MDKQQNKLELYMKYSLRKIASSRHICSLSTVNFNRKITAHVSTGNLHQAHKLFDECSHLRNVVSWNSLITGYVKSSRIVEAQKMFDQMPLRDVVSWNTMLSGFRDDPEKSHRHFLQMLRLRHRPDELTFSVLISSLLNSEFIVLIPQLHCLVINLGIGLNIYLGSSLMRGYIALGDGTSLCRVFDEILIKDVAPWNVLILGYMEFGLTTAARRAFDEMPKKTAFSWSTLINGYIKNGMINEARAVFDQLSEKDVVSWTAMVRGYVKIEMFVEALDLFMLMMSSATRPNHYTFSSVLDACAGFSSLVTGSQIHSCILKFGIPLDVVLGTSLVDMYGKCGDINAAFHVFQLMKTKNLVSWNSIIGDYARHGLASRALEEFDKMVKSKLTPDQVSFINVLSACVHGGMVKEGEEIFNSMGARYGMEAEMKHYSCMVDLYGRAGELEKAEELIKGMPFEPDVAIWGALLTACGLHSCLGIAEIAASGICKLEKDHPAVYSMLSKIYGDNGARSNVFQLGKMMQQWRSKKQKAGSWI